MEKKLLNLSIEIDQRHVNTFAEVSTIAEELGIPFVVVGAMARDLILHHVYGARVKRATEDIDFGMQVGTWDEFDRLKSALCEEGFSEDRQAQRLIDPRGRIVDLVPFGPLQDADANIGFPPKGDFKMSVLGFQEALDSSIRVIIQKNPNIEVSVVSPQGLALLKIIAWDDRVREKRNKDASDLSYLLEAYERVSDIRERAFEVEGLMEFVDYDLPQASAYLLGQDAAEIAKDGTKAVVIDILNTALDEDNPSDLVIEMSNRSSADLTSKFALLASFNKGFRGHVE